MLMVRLRPGRKGTRYRLCINQYAIAGIQKPHDNTSAFVSVFSLHELLSRPSSQGPHVVFCEALFDPLESDKCLSALMPFRPRR